MKRGVLEVYEPNIRPLYCGEAPEKRFCDRQSWGEQIVLPPLSEFIKGSLPPVQNDHNHVNIQIDHSNTSWYQNYQTEYRFLPVKNESVEVQAKPISPSEEHSTLTFQSHNKSGQLNDGLVSTRELAYHMGLTTDATKNWRYRDIRRSLFEKLSEDHIAFLNTNNEHSMVHQRLPHKQSLVDFCKRIVAVVFHFIVRDASEPKFWRREELRKDMIIDIVRNEDPDFYRRFNASAAKSVRLCIIKDKVTVGEAIRRTNEANQNTSLYK
ncbi:2-succinyl-5-enolpyruvyl-6-hydroxy-3-cyclohexene-1-carboxylate synthase [Acrasis kona]|uniref:2-succinyl-5-enolpyruvyl-6-hydroxy-3-cyclohexene-1-carboxylate synthase n=1 Tax=Acrasis kona TaxID=1008807 RepID=A0AAW2YMI2_9EUKA